MMATFRGRQGRELALVSWVLGLCAARAGAHAGDAASVTTAATPARTAPSVKYEALFKSPWNEDSSYHGLQHLEHVNIGIPRHGPAKRLYYDILGFAPDARRAQNIVKGSGTIWANMGTTQVHLPEGEPQVVPGTIGLVYDDLDFDEVVARLKGATGGVMNTAAGGDINGNSSGHSSGSSLFEGTKFAWREEREEVPGEEEGETTESVVSVTCPYGNVFRLHKRKKTSLASSSTTTTTTTASQEQSNSNQDVNSKNCNKAEEGSGAGALLDPRGGRLPNVAAVDEQQRPYSPTLGLGISYVSFRVKPGTSAGIARFYREIFSTEVEEVVGDGGGGGGGDGGGREGSCATEGDSAKKSSCSCSAQQSEARETGAAAAAVVRVGPVQHLEFVEEGDEALHAPDEYDGHHICVYLSEEGFRRSYVQAERRGLVFVNPRRNFGKADTLEKALEEKQFRIKDMVDPSTGELLHMLEHEVRSVSHPSYPVARDLSLPTETPM